METKICTKCKKDVVRTSEFFPIDKRRSDGLRSECRVCANRRSNEYNKKHPRNNKEYRDSHREHLNVLQRKYYLQHPEYAATRASWNNKNKEKLAQFKRKWRANNRKNNARKLQEWRKINPEKNSIYANRRSALKNKLISSFTTTDWEQTKAFFNFKCAYCGRKTKLTQDHLIPLSKNGNYCFGNIVPACQRCNSSKGNRNMWEWYLKQEICERNRSLRIEEFLHWSKAETSQVNVKNVAG
jgi:5-methylcytosine-specific restriction endonuclease McrA